MPLDSFDPKFSLGDVVAFNTSPFLRNNVYVNILLAAKKDNQPLMVVKEISINTKKENLFDSSTKIPIAECIKYTCIWFDAEKYKFNEACFYESYLVKVDIVTKVIDKKEIKLSSNFKFKTHSLEGIKFYSDSLLSSSPQLKPINTFLAPTFSFRGIKNIDNSIIVDKDGIKTKETSSVLIKVMWYNSSLNKFSEELVPIDCLEFVSNEVESVEFQRLKKDKSLIVEEGKPFIYKGNSYRLFLEEAGELLNIPDQQYAGISSKMMIGKFVENCIFRTIDAKFKIFFSEGADWLKSYMDKNNLKVKRRKLFIKDDDAKLYGQVDLLVKKNDADEYWLIDIVSGNLTVEKEDRGKKFEKTNAGKKYLKRLALFSAALKKYSIFKSVPIKRVVLLISPFRCCELYHD